MFKEEIGVASTVEDAEKKAKAALNAPEGVEVKVEVIEQAQKKLFGLFGGSDAKVRAYYEIPDMDPIGAYIKRIFEGMGVKNVEIETRTEDEEIIYEVKTDDDCGVLIGRHGETLDAIQYLVRLFANKKVDGDKRVSVNVGDYREKRAENLKALAEKNASQVLKFGRSAKLEPMNPYERRIVHTTIQSIEGVTSHSVGFDAERRVVITLEEGVEPTVVDKRKFNNNKGDHRGGYNKGGYNKRGNGGYKPQSDRQPRSDFASGSRYGKIEVKKDETEE